jgi:hypothetical protein
VELVEEEDGMRLPIGTEDPVDGHPQIAGGGMSVLHGEVEDGVIDRAGEPAMNAALCSVPLWVIRLRRSGVVDV